MELVSPVVFVYALATPLLDHTATSLFEAFSSFDSALFSLPLARALLAVLFLAHYFNRSIVSTFRNPGRGDMHLSVFLSAVTFNMINGFLMGTWIGGGGDLGSNDGYEWGVKDGSWPVFVSGLILFVLGHVGTGFLCTVPYWTQGLTARC